MSSPSPSKLALAAVTLDHETALIQHTKQAAPNFSNALPGALIGALSLGGIQGIRRLFASERDKRNGTAPSILNGLLLGGLGGGLGGMALPHLQQYLREQVQAGERAKGEVPKIFPTGGSLPKYLSAYADLPTDYDINRGPTAVKSRYMNPDFGSPGFQKAPPQLDASQYVPGRTGPATSASDIDAIRSSAGLSPLFGSVIRPDDAVPLPSFMPRSQNGGIGLFTNQSNLENWMAARRAARGSDPVGSLLQPPEYLHRPN